MMLCTDLACRPGMLYPYDASLLPLDTDAGTGDPWTEPTDTYLGPVVTPEPIIPRPGQCPPQSAPSQSGRRSGGSRLSSIKPQQQPTGNSCGLTSVAMALTGMTGRPWSAAQVQDKYGLGLLQALNQETRDQGLVWRDRNFSTKSWPLIEEKLRLGRPVIMGLNGPDFSPSGRGHIITVVGLKGDQVMFLDPALGKRRSLPRSAFENAAQYPQGNFFFYASKEQPART